MHYTCEITINRPVDEVVNAFMDPEGIYEWMEGLQSVKHLEGEEGRPGAKTEMTFKNKNRTFSMVETIKENKLPDLYSASYTTKGVENNMDVRFEKIDENCTLYHTDQEFLFSSFGMRLMGKVMKGAFKKQTMKYLEAFKHYAEKRS